MNLAQRGAQRNTGNTADKIPRRPGGPARMPCSCKYHAGIRAILKARNLTGVLERVRVNFVPPSRGDPRLGTPPIVPPGEPVIKCSFRSRFTGFAAVRSHART